MKEIWESIKKVMKTKVFIIIVSVVVVFYIVLFPHTKTSTVNTEFTGVFIIQKERYLLHTRVEFDKEYICVPGTTINSETINYRLNGDIKSKSISNCDGTYENIEYNSNGTVSSYESTTFIGLDIRINNQEYNSVGLLETAIINFSGDVAEITNTYYATNVLKESTEITKQYGLIVSEDIYKYDEDSQITELASKTWVNDVLETNIKTEYTEGIVSRIVYLDLENNYTASISCDITGCILNNLTAGNYTVQYNIADLDYDMLVSGEDSSVKITFTQIDETNIASVLAEIQAKAQLILDAQ